MKPDWTIMATAATKLCLAWLVVVVLALGTTGCVIIPIPTPHYNTGFARTNLTQLTPRQFTPGHSTREDVILTLGEPDAVSADEQALVYRSEKTVAFLIIGTVGGATGGPMDKQYFYFFAFDSQGHLQSITQTNRLLGCMNFGDSAVPAGLTGERIWRIYPNCCWLANVNGYQARDTVSMIGDQGRLFLTESNLVFYSRTGFANDEPAMRLPLLEVSGVWLDKYFLVQRLVVRAKSGQFHSFEIHKTGGIRLDKPAMQAACDFIQSKIIPTQPEK
jgi:hypothetical protein